jgi:hypothetical protein
LKVFCVIALSFLLFSCASGPVYMAKTEAESMRTAYDDPQLKMLSSKHDGLLKDIYSRYQKANVAFYNQGLGFTSIRDPNGKGQPYLMVNVRPGEICFDETGTKPQQRLSEVLTKYFEKYLSFMTKDDLASPDIKGLAFGVYWPVRDFSQCDTYGGFLEYAMVFIRKGDFGQLKDRLKTFPEVAEDSEVLVSQQLSPAVSVRPVFR